MHLTYSLISVISTPFLPFTLSSVTIMLHTGADSISDLNCSLLLSIATEHFMDFLISCELPR
jgi:hypothetical protein